MDFLNEGEAADADDSAAVEDATVEGTEDGGAEDSEGVAGADGSEDEGEAGTDED